VSRFPKKTQLTTPGVLFLDSINKKKKGSRRQNPLSCISLNTGMETPFNWEKTEVKKGKASPSATKRRRLKESTEADKFQKISKKGELQ
jgi:hypothetical protein